MPDRVPAATEWAERYGYSRAVRAGDLIEVAGTVGRGDGAHEQARAHGEVFGEIRPEFVVEIEATASVQARALD